MRTACISTTAAVASAKPLYVLVLFLGVLFVSFIHSPHEIHHQSARDSQCNPLIVNNPQRRQLGGHCVGRQPTLSYVFDVWRGQSNCAIALCVYISSYLAARRPWSRGLPIFPACSCSGLCPYFPPDRFQPRGLPINICARA